MGFSSSAQKLHLRVTCLSFFTFAPFISIITAVIEIRAITSAIIFDIYHVQFDKKSFKNTLSLPQLYSYKVSSTLF
jgi:hypothetical protein